MGDRMNPQAARRSAVAAALTAFAVLLTVYMVSNANHHAASQRPWGLGISMNSDRGLDLQDLQAAPVTTAAAAVATTAAATAGATTAAMPPVPATTVRRRAAPTAACASKHCQLCVTYHKNGDSREPVTPITDQASCAAQCRNVFSQGDGGSYKSEGGNPM